MNAHGCILYLLTCVLYLVSVACVVSAEQISRMALSFFITVIIYMRQFFNHSTAACGQGDLQRHQKCARGRVINHATSRSRRVAVPPLSVCSIVNRVVTFVTQLKVVFLFFCAGTLNMQHTHTLATLINIERLHSTTFDT